MNGRGIAAFIPTPVLIRTVVTLMLGRVNIIRTKESAKLPWMRSTGTKHHQISYLNNVSDRILK